MPAVDALIGSGDCFTVGHLVMIGVFAVILILVLCTCTVCRKQLNNINCGPTALAASFSAVRNVPKNKSLDQNASKIGVSRQNTPAARMFVHGSIICCCVVGCGGVAFALVVAINALSSGGKAITP